MRKLLYLMSMNTLLLVAILIVIGTYWTIFPYKTIEINTNVLPTDKTEYHAGEMLFYTLDYCKYTTKPVRITRTFVDGVKYTMNDVTANNPKGCHKVHIPVLVPNLPSGTYSIQVDYSYEVNPIRIVTTSINTSTFTIEEVK